MSSKDKRSIRMTGKYKTRDALQNACEKYKALGETYPQIAMKVGVSQTTVQRLLSGDPMTTTPKYKPAVKKSAIKLDDFWKIQVTP